MSDHAIGKITPIVQHGQPSFGRTPVHHDVGGTDQPTHIGGHIFVGLPVETQKRPYQLAQDHYRDCDDLGTGQLGFGNPALLSVVIHHNSEQHTGVGAYLHRWPAQLSAIASLNCSTVK